MMLLWPILQHGEDEYVGPLGSLSRAATRRTPPRNFPSIQPRNAMHQGIPIPRPQRHNAMFSMGSGGPGRTRTFDQGIMSFHFPVQEEEIKVRMYEGKPRPANLQLY
jgi:hypothetical protein